MNKTQHVHACLFVAALLAWPMAQATTIAKADYKAGKARISADYKAGKAACASSNGNAKDVCIQEAKAKEKVALAQLEFDYSAKPADQNRLLVARAESTYAVSKERCDDLSGNAKDVCVKQAKAVEVKALADAKLGKEIGAARSDANADKRDADYKVEAEKCESLAGDARTSCVAAAKSRYGKT